MFRLATTDRGFILYLSLVMAALRVIFSDAPENIDLVEQLAFLDAWKLAYSSGANPPLFTWLAKFALAVLGERVAAIELVRFVALWLACVFTWFAARRILAPASTNPALGQEDVRLAALAGLAPFSSIMLGWEAIFRYSNTTLLIMSIAFAFYALVRLDQRPAISSYVLLGVAVGVGLMSKVNFAVFLVALAAAALSEPGLRARLIDRRIAATLTAAAVIVSPFVIWLVTRTEAVVAHGHQRMTLPPSYGYLGVPVPVSLLLDVVVGVAGIVVPLLFFVALFAPLAFRPGWAVATGSVERYQRCISVHLAAMLALVAGGLSVFEVTQLQVHYFFAFDLLVMLVMLRVAAANPAPKRFRWLGEIIAAMPLIVVAVALVRGLTYGAS
jgi:hypothetical protein